MPPVHLLEGVGDLADGRLGAGGVHGEREQVAVAVACPRSAQFVSASRAASTSVLVALGAQPLELGDLLAVDVVVVDPEDVELVLRGEPEGVDADHLLRAGVDPGLGAGGGLLDAHLRDALLDRCGHATGGLGLLDVRPRPLREVMGQLLDVVGAGPGVDRVRRTALLLQQELGVARDPRGEVGRQRDRLVEGVGVQRLGVALGRCHRLDAGAADVVEDVLGGEAPAGGLQQRRPHLHRGDGGDPRPARVAARRRPRRGDRAADRLSPHEIAATPLLLQQESGTDVHDPPLGRFDAFES